MLLRKNSWIIETMVDRHAITLRILGLTYQKFVADDSAQISEIPL